jgi:hypothetical protein
MNSLAYSSSLQLCISTQQLGLKAGSHSCLLVCSGAEDIRDRTEHLFGQDYQDVVELGALGGDTRDIELGLCLEE